MSEFSDELTEEVETVAKSRWDSRDGQVVPKTEDLRLGNDRVVLDAVMLYADLADSTELAIHNQEIASEIFKCYLRGVTKIIQKNGGEVRSFDGDRVMGIFLGDTKNTSAANCGLNINWFFQKVIIETFRSSYPKSLEGLNLDQTVGIDRSKIYVARAGIRNNNDLIWVGRAPNIAAKLSSVRKETFGTFITKTVYASMLDSSRFSSSGENMWQHATWGDGSVYGVEEVYESSWRRRP